MVGRSAMTTASKKFDHERGLQKAAKQREGVEKTVQARGIVSAGSENWGTSCEVTNGYEKRGRSTNSNKLTLDI